MQNVGIFTTRLKNAKFDGCKNDNFQLYFSYIFLLLLFFKHRLRVHILTLSDTNQAAQLPGMDRSLKFLDLGSRGNVLSK